MWDTFKGKVQKYEEKDKELLILEEPQKLIMFLKEKKY